jgi:hypothetical protein
MTKPGWLVDSARIRVQRMRPSQHRGGPRRYVNSAPAARAGFIALFIALAE